MSEYRLTERAETEILEIFLDSIEMFGVIQARRYKDELDYCFKLLAETPHMGRLAETLGSGVRRHEHKSHVILYEQEANGILVLALVPGRSVRQLKL
ncbi:type II toxin-antitoxin system RelE/ParE family toxin [Phyllobacterium bourgognense]|uniref:type II toxin-antitoxin system RelE/ParE family toxin n=1 Tax=Phyllobacterium bourgognense TaxID=314236 RepID=UPI000DF1A90B|nr:type II toxin-antitoxin system RelE/ParE family toxin [Phyllobacterium bourgognense]